jgi:hypothetical protein
MPRLKMLSSGLDAILVHQLLQLFRTDGLDVFDTHALEMAAKVWRSGSLSTHGCVVCYCKT